jgi:hypothetical protein
MEQQNQVAIHELERALKYREREVKGFQDKLLLLNEQKAQYENDLIPKFLLEIEQIKDTIEQLRFVQVEDDLPF